MKQLVVILALLSSPALATINTVQVKCTGTTTTDGCGASPCTLSGLTAITAHNALWAVLLNDTNNQTISSVNGETWTACASCRKTGSASQEVDASYVLNATGGETSVQMTLSGTSSFNFCVFEYHTTTSGFTFDNACNSLLSTAAPTTCAIGSLTGTNDVKVGAIVWGGSLTAVSAPGADFIESNGNGTADVLNVVTTTGISFTPTTSNSGPTFMAALKENAASIQVINCGIRGKVGVTGRVGCK